MVWDVEIGSVTISNIPIEEHKNKTTQALCVLINNYRTRGFLLSKSNYIIMNKKRIAIPMVNNMLSEHFGHCQAFAFVDVENDKITEVTTMDPPEHTPGSFPKWVAANGATDVIAGGMGGKAINLFNESGVNAFVGAPVDTPTNLVNQFIAGELTLSANYCEHDENHSCGGH